MISRFPSTSNQMVLKACKCTKYPELGKLLYESTILYITSYFYEEVIYTIIYYSIKKVTPLYYYYFQK